MSKIQQIIEQAFEKRADINPGNVNSMAASTAFFTVELTLPGFISARFSNARSITG